ncbi:M1 family metallopeptidase [Puia dinghuensis]|uniref:Peptidase n=1 Tax=Puia dinghuensis TaxID=1792502 RepID=A0A8J2XRV1_9BACT|nr:M1 family metallopeptidase [Puia dinghuensis]GGA90641.1 peptidase [Puia dinghuensis]
MLRPLLILLFAAFSSIALYSQSLYIPRDIKEAYKKGTRSPDGRPGSHYWQNKGRYDITVTATPPDRTVRGSETITYFNNSPDTLKTLVFRLTINIHKPGAVRLSQADSAYLTPGIAIDTYAENGKSKTWHNNPQDGTWKQVRLNTPLTPHDSIRLDIGWHYTISQRSNREGMIDSTTYFLAYFYPRVAVYDDYNGWDLTEFNDMQEFYNDFNDYTLRVKAPANYIVWATGDLQNPDAVLNPAYAKKLAASSSSDNIVSIATPGEIAQGKVTRSNTLNAWVWKATDITDVTCALSNHFAWDASSVVVDDATGRRASVQSAYNDSAKDFHRMVEFGRHALDWLSHHWPGVSYPFPKTTIVQGFADMEYPMMVNDNTNEDPSFSRLVAEHEIAHSWFPFYMGINESRFAYMDEGWATTFELLIGKTDLGEKRAEDMYKEFRVNYYTYDPAFTEDLPIITPTDALTPAAYSNNAYGKPSLAYLAVKDLLGDEMFRKCLHTYMDRWHGKHPIPWDFFNSFNDASGKNLNWFWTNWFFSNNYLDLAIDGAIARTSDGASIVTIHNIGGFAIPFDLVVTYTDSSTDRFHQTPAVWSTNQSKTAITLPPKTGKTIHSIEVNNGIFVDADPSNNKWTVKQ